MIRCKQAVTNALFGPLLPRPGAGHTLESDQVPVQCMTVPLIHGAEKPVQLPFRTAPAALDLYRMRLARPLGC